MSVDETLLCSFQVRRMVLVTTSFSLFCVCADSKTCGEESKVSIWRDEHGPTGNTAAQAKEEGWQDGLRSPWPGAGGAPSPWQGSPFALSLPHCTAFHHSFHPFPSLYVLLFGVAIRR